MKPRTENRRTESNSFRSIISSSFKCYYQSKRTNPPYNSDNLSSTITQLKRRHDSLTSTIQYRLNQQTRLRPLTMQSFLTTYVAKGTRTYTLQPSKWVRNILYEAEKLKRSTYSFSSHSDYTRSSHENWTEKGLWRLQSRSSPALPTFFPSSSFISSQNALYNCFL
jgi:hypothetical protein